MNFTCRKYDLQSKLAKIESVVTKDKKEADAPTAYFMFDLVGKTLWISASCLELKVLTEMRVDTDDQGCLLVDAKKITELLKALPDKMIQVKANYEKMNISITVDRSKYVIRGLDRTLFPAVEMPPLWEHKISSRFMKQALARCTSLVSGESSSIPHLSGALFSLENRKLEMMSTDDNQLAVVTDAVENDGKFYVIIPKKTLVELGTALSECSDPYIEFTGNDKSAFFRVGNSIYISRVLYGRMPNYPVLINNRLKLNQRNFKIHRANLLASLKRCIIFNEKDTGNRVFFDFTSDELNVRTANSHGDAASEFVQVRTEEKSGCSIQANGQYFINYLTAVEDEFIDLLMETAENPLIFRSEGSREFIFLISPLKQG